MRGISAFVALLLCGASAVMPGTVRAQAVGMGLILIAISEMVAADDGIGFMIWNAWQVLTVDTMYVGLLVIAILGFVFLVVLDEIERWLIPWKSHA
jgi:ABC-type nitrate/sulfonate/bicarbonate transport system permease component